ncbi:2026_t:CDS:2, partial [Entrophospora sp. SA101]
NDDINIEETNNTDNFHYNNNIDNNININSNSDNNNDNNINDNNNSNIAMKRMRWTNQEKLILIDHVFSTETEKSYGQ